MQLEPKNPKSLTELQSFVASYDWWYQRVYLGQGMYTIPGEHAAHHESVWAAVSPCFGTALEGKSFLDIGTNAGYFALQAALAGATRVLGIDSVKAYIEQAEKIREIWDVDIDYRIMDAHEIASIGETFDVVMFAGVLYHLKHPFAAIEAVAKLCSDTVVVETEVVPPSDANRIHVRLGAPGDVKTRVATNGFMKFIEGTELNGDPTNWWVPDTECLLGMLRASGFQSFSKAFYPWEGRVVLLASKRPQHDFDFSKLP